MILVSVAYGAYFEKHQSSTVPINRFGSRERIKDLLSAYYVLGNLMHMPSSLVLLQGRYFYAHYTDDETKA